MVEGAGVAQEQAEWAERVERAVAVARLGGIGPMIPRPEADMSGATYPWEPIVDVVRDVWGGAGAFHALVWKERVRVLNEVYQRVYRTKETPWSP